MIVGFDNRLEFEEEYDGTKSGEKMVGLLGLQSMSRGGKFGMILY